MMKTPYLVLSLLLLISVISSTAQNTPIAGAGILFYNVENLFNPEDDPQKDDDEFTDKGMRHWNYSRAGKKQNNIARVILYSGKWNPPVLVGLCEIEDEKILKGLIWNTGLNNLSYSFEHFDSPDKRGIDVALLYRRDRFRVLNSHPVPVKMDDDQRPTRDILYVCGLMDGLDTLHVVVNHWPSRWGGEATTREKRRKAALTLRNLCDSVLKDNPHSRIIAMGDFNDEPADMSLKLVSDSTSDSADLKLMNLGYFAEGKVSGTIKHKFEWAVFDQILVSKSLLRNNRREGFVLERPHMSIKGLPFLLEKDPEYPGYRANRTYIGYKYHGGYSDHLPVMITLTYHQHE